MSLKCAEIGTASFLRGCLLDKAEVTFSSGFPHEAIRRLGAKCQGMVHRKEAVPLMESQVENS